ncbi:MAG: YidC/Oxa1 family membrane protein insertase, partial [Oscillospiraceae bacterium]
MDIISVPMGWILKQLSHLCGGNFAIAVFIFTVLVNLVMLPLTIKSQKSTAKQAKLKPRLDAIKKKCGDDKMKYQQATQDLYSTEGISMSGGCL